MDSNQDAAADFKTLWQKAQERLATNRKFAARNNKTSFYLLRSLLVCDVCGHTMLGRNIHGRIFYYCPNQGPERSPDVAAHTRTITGLVIEPLVWQAVTQLLQNPTLLADAWENETQAEQHAPEETGRLQSRLKALERQWQRLLDLFQDEKIEKAELSNRKEHIDQERQSIQARLQRFNQLAQQERVKQTMLKDFASFCQQINANAELAADVDDGLVGHPESAHLTSSLQSLRGRNGFAGKGASGVVAAGGSLDRLEPLQAGPVGAQNATSGRLCICAAGFGGLH